MWTFVDPGFYQRCYAAKSPKVAKYGILTAVVFWIFFDFLTTTAGLYARVLLTDINPVMAFPRLGALVLPPFFLGIFIVGLLATIMSTLDSNAFLSAVTFGRDLIWRNKKDKSIKFYTRVGLVVTIAFSTLLIVLLPSVVKMWYTLGSLIIPSLLLPVMITFLNIKKYFKDGWILTSMLAGFFSSLIWYGIGIWSGSFETPIYIFNLQPFYVGLGANLTIILFNIFKEKGGK
jgi:SSS family solute:Na+ symporter